MRVAVEIVGAEDVGDPIRRAVVEQQAAEHRLLGLDRMGRNLERFELAIVGHAEGFGLAEGTAILAAGRRALRPAASAE